MARGPNPIEVILSEQEVQALEKCVRRHTTTQQIAQRVRIIQAAAVGRNNAQIARELGVSIDKVRLWRRRWVEWQDMPLEEYSVEIRLSDVARSGSPGKFSAEEVAQIIAIACEIPQDSGYPVSHWTPQEIALEAEKRGIVSSISQRQVGRFLKRGGSPTAS
jgi:putative transposase